MDTKKKDINNGEPTEEKKVSAERVNLYTINALIKNASLFAERNIALEQHINFSKIRDDATAQLREQLMEAKMKDIVTIKMLRAENAELKSKLAEYERADRDKARHPEVLDNNQRIGRNHRGEDGRRNSF